MASTPLQCLQRKDLQDTGAALPKPLPSLYEAISCDEDAVLRTIMQITSGITSIVDNVQKWVAQVSRKPRSR